MKIGCVREIKNNEFRVGLTPDNVKSYVSAGHEVLMEAGAGAGSGFADEEYTAAGARVNLNAVFDTKVSVNLRARQNGKATVFRFSSGRPVRPVC